jgi:hypothetical protein
MDYTQRRISDNLGAELAGGRTVQQVIDERFGRVAPATDAALDEALSYLDPAAADAAARDFTAKHGR